MRHLGLYINKIKMYKLYYLPSAVFIAQSLYLNAGGNPAHRRTGTFSPGAAWGGGGGKGGKGGDINARRNLRNARKREQ